MRKLTHNDHGATLLLQLPRQRFTQGLVKDALMLLFGLDDLLPTQKRGTQKPEWLAYVVSKVYDERQSFEVVTLWDSPRDGALGGSMCAQYHLDPTNPLDLPSDDSVWLTVWLFPQNLAFTDSSKVNRVVANFKGLVQKLKPTFAAIDNYPESMVKRKGKDPRRFAWGAMYYDADHAQRIGIDKLRNCSALLKEEWPDDSFWVQAWANPFVVAKELTQQFERELALKEAFPEGAATVARPKAKAVKAK